jgi:hypothetical protein
MLPIGAPSRDSLSSTSRSGSGNGNGFSSTASISENTAVLAPMTIASVATTVSVNPGVRASTRTA